MTKGLRVLVCGGREYQDRDALWGVLDRIDVKRGIGCIIQGGAPGADAWAKCWARNYCRPSLQVDAWWPEMNKAAGPARNRWMLEWCLPDVVVAFPGGRGTASMVKLARDAGVKVWEPIAGNAA